MGDVNGVPVIGQPLVYGVGFVVLLLVVLTGSWVGSLVTVAHEGGHMVTAVATLRGFRGFSLADGGGGATSGIDTRWGLGDLIVTFAGYLTPPLLGLGGAAVVVHGNPWGVLASVVVLLLAAFLVAENALAVLVTLVALVAVVWIALAGSTTLVLAVAVGAVWLLLLGGVRAAVIMSRGDGSDAYWMARRTLLPTLVWKTVWVTAAVVALVAGARLLLVGDAWPDGAWPFDTPSATT